MFESLTSKLGDSTGPIAPRDCQNGIFGRDKGEEDLLAIVWLGGEGLIEGLLRLVGLLVDELAADVVLVGEPGDRL